MYYFVLKNLKYTVLHTLLKLKILSHKRVNHVRPSRLRLRNDKKVNQKKDKSTVRIYHLGPWDFHISLNNNIIYRTL